ncbi:hypothetical protein [Flavobacterium sp.]
MHKEATYGKILLKQKFKQTEKQIQNFALQIAKVSAFDFAEIESPLTELVSEGVLIIQDDYLICKRMVRDGEISEARSKAGKSGGVSNKKKNFAYANNEAKPEAKDQTNQEANLVIENEVVSVIENEIEIVTAVEVEKPKKAKSELKKIEIVFPFFTENFKAQWQLWKAYKSKEHNFKYKSELSEQASLNELSNLSGGNETIAIAIMNQSMTKGWKGFFALKNNNQNGNRNNNSQQSDAGTRQAANNAVDKMLGQQ